MDLTQECVTPQISRAVAEFEATQARIEEALSSPIRDMKELEALDKDVQKMPVDLGGNVAKLHERVLQARKWCEAVRKAAPRKSTAIAALKERATKEEVREVARGEYRVTQSCAFFFHFRRLTPQFTLFTDLSAHRKFGYCSYRSRDLFQISLKSSYFQYMECDESPWNMRAHLLGFGSRIGGQSL